MTKGFQVKFDHRKVISVVDLPLDYTHDQYADLLVGPSKPGGCELGVVVCIVCWGRALAFERELEIRASESPGDNASEADPAIWGKPTFKDVVTNAWGVVSS